jgi:hypothetical protein
MVAFVITILLFPVLETVSLYVDITGLHKPLNGETVNVADTSGRV